MTTSERLMAPLYDHQLSGYSAGRSHKDHQQSCHPSKHQRPRWSDDESTLTKVKTAIRTLKNVKTQESPYCCSSTSWFTPSFDRVETSCMSGSFCCPSLVFSWCSSSILAGVSVMHLILLPFQYHKAVQFYLK